jgi:hypothetical protein
LALLLVVLLAALAWFVRGLVKLTGRREPLTPQDALPSNRPHARQTDLKMLVQLPLTERFGSPAEQADYARLSQALRAALPGDERGAFGGALLARGVEILTVGNVEPAAWEDALAVVLRVLEQEGLLQGAVIVRQEGAAGNPSPLCVAVWPENWSGPVYRL